jgi:hypothetical protein
VEVGWEAKGDKAADVVAGRVQVQQIDLASDRPEGRMVEVARGAATAVAVLEGGGGYDE